MKKIKEEIVYNGRRKISKAIFRTDKGEEVEYELRVGGECASVLAITKEGKFILVKQFRVGPNRMTIDLPGGGVDEGETPIQAVERELLEETGYKGNLKFVNKIHSDAYSTSTEYNFIATDCIKVTNKTEDTCEAVLMSLSELLETLKRGDTINTASAYLGLVELEYLTKTSQNERSK